MTATPATSHRSGPGDQLEAEEATVVHIIGTNDPDVYVGTKLADLIFRRTGDDLLDGRIAVHRVSSLRNK